MQSRKHYELEAGVAHPDQLAEMVPVDSELIPSNSVSSKVTPPVDDILAPPPKESGNHDRFVLLANTFDGKLAREVCASLEEADIAVLLEHVEISEGGVRASSFRILIPYAHTPKATLIYDAHKARARGRGTLTVPSKAA